MIMLLRVATGNRPFSSSYLGHGGGTGTSVLALELGKFAPGRKMGVKEGQSG